LKKFNETHRAGSQVRYNTIISLSYIFTHALISAWPAPLQNNEVFFFEGNDSSVIFDKNLPSFLSSVITWQFIYVRPKAFKS